MKKLRANKITALIIIVLSITIFWCCKKTDYKQPTVIPVVSTVNSSVTGVVTDLNNVPVSNASVAAGTSTATTDVNGKFSITNAQLSAVDGFVVVSKNGYFNGSRTFFVNSGTVNNVKIQLIPKKISGTFPASSGGNINTSSGVSVNFSSGIVNVTSGAAYSGDVSVSTFYLNPSDPNFNQYMPGDLRGINASNKENILQSFGMVSVELDDANGNKLQIASGKTAAITLPIPSAMQATAPAAIPLWYFDETTGIWKQEGTATKQGNSYLGTVAHFSFWTAGQLAQSIKLNAKFVFDTGSVILPVANQLITITSSNYGTTNGYTDSIGTINGLVPANESLTMKVFNHCGDSIYEKNIGPFNTDISLGTLTVSSNTCYTPPAVITLSATLKDQNGSALVGNVVSITNATFLDSSLSTNSAGQFSTAVPSGQSFVMKVYDQCGDSIYAQNIGPFISVIDLGTITVTVTPSVSITLSGTVVDCNNKAVTGGKVYANIGNNQYTSSITNGSFAITFNRCSSLLTAASITVYDVATAQDITAQQITVTNTNQNIGQITIPCGTTLPDSSYINLTLHSANYSWIAPNDSLGAERIDSGSYYNTSIHGGFTGTNAPNPLKYILLGINNDNASPGTYSLNLYINLNDSTYNSGGLSTTVTEFGAVGGYIAGTASGQVLLQPNVTLLPFTCSFRVKRTQ